VKEVLLYSEHGSYVLPVEAGRWPNEGQTSRGRLFVIPVLLRMRSNFVFEGLQIMNFFVISVTADFSEPNSLCSVLQENSPWICEHLSLCSELREGLLA
jgi:hypothetical protein